MTALRQMQALPRADSLRLLSSVSLGRVVFTHLALPAVRPVNHAVDRDRIIIRAYLGTAIGAVLGGRPDTILAYEADLIDPDIHLGWSVIVVGRASRLTESAETARYRDLLRPWVAGGRDDIIAIQADMVDGFRLIETPV
ncbi:MAG: pyridoxamine 5'-phosphate oxidase family protein [Streptosporangiaceae bacterium]